MASSGESISKAGTLLTAYSLGLGIPFLLTALALNQAQSVLRRLQQNMRTIEAFSGVFLIAIGVLVLTGQLQRLSALGSGDGSLGRLSLNLENCTVGVFEGRIRPANWTDCLGEGLKDDFYIAAPKETAQSQPLAVAGLPGTSDAQPGDGTASQAAPDGGLNTPDLSPNSGAEGGLGVPDLSADPANGQPAPSPETSDIAVGLEVGRRAPDFTTQTLDGQTVSLSDYRGKVVLLNFWATWCEPCDREMPDFQAIYSKEQDNGFVVLAVDNQEAPGDVAQFVTAHKLTFPILLDEDGAINGSIYGDRVLGYPTSFLIDRNGVIVRYFPGELNGSDLLEALDSLLRS
jgi:peroxiredoxin